MRMFRNIYSLFLCVFSCRCSSKTDQFYQILYIYVFLDHMLHIWVFHFYFIHSYASVMATNGLPNRHSTWYTVICILLVIALLLDDTSIQFELLSSVWLSQSYFLTLKHHARNCFSQEHRSDIISTSVDNRNERYTLCESHSNTLSINLSSTSDVLLQIVRSFVCSFDFVP